MPTEADHLNAILKALEPPRERAYSCKICKGIERWCLICGDKSDVDIEYEKERQKDLQIIWNALRKGQARTTGIPEIDKEILELFGPWIVEPRPIPVSTIMLLYSEAHRLEHDVKDRKKARQAYIRLYDKMKDSDRIHYRITRNDIKLKIQHLTLKGGK